MADDAERRSSRLPLERVCVACGAVVEGERCWLCGAPTAETGVLASRPTSAASQPHTSQTFALSTLFLLVTLISVCLGAIVAAPGLGIPLAILAVPAFVRASASIGREESSGRRLDVLERISVFVGSLGVVLLICLAGFAAFFAACLVTCPIALGARSDALIFLSIGIAGVLAVGVISWLLYKTWPRMRGPWQ